jgi:nitroreductase
MDTWDAIRARRNVRQFTDRPVGRDHLEQILEAGRRSPSSRNWQPWDFVVVTERERLAELAKVWMGAGHVARSSATIALVIRHYDGPPERDWAQYDLGQATMAMMLAATNLGIGTAHAAVADQDMARSLLGFPDDHECAYLMALGYPADRPLTPVLHPTRRDFDDVVHWDRW